MERVELKRQLGFFDGVMVIAGSTIGIGIFVTTGFIAQSISSPGMILLIWLLGGGFALAGALCCAELGASLPYAGGDYIYLREAYGSITGFLSGWSSFLVTFSGSIAFLAVAFTEHVAFFFPFLSRDRTLFSLGLLNFEFHISQAQLFSIILLLVFSAIHTVGVKKGSRIHNILTVLKIGVLLGIVLFAIVVGKGSPGHFSPLFEMKKVGELSALGLAFIPVLFTYAGWNAVIYMAGEVKEAEKTVPAALLWANLLIIVLYLAINAVYIYAIPVEQMQGTLRVAEVATTALFGYQTSAWITAVIGLSILGTLSVMIMTGPRIYLAMAQDGLFFQRLSRIHPRFHTPTNAIILQALWSSLLILTGTFNALLTYVTFVIVLFSALTVGAVLVLRIKRPELNRPYKIRGYPGVPVLFILAHVGIASATLWERPFESFLAVGIVGIGIPVYFFWQNRIRKEGGKRV